MRASHTTVVAALLALSAPARAQTLEVTELVAGGTATFEVAGALPGDLAVLAVGFAGLGAGLCLDGSTCLDLAGVPTVLGFAPADAGGEVAFALPLATSVPTIAVAAQAVLVTAGPTVSFATTPAVAGSIAAVDALSDEFDGAALGEGWSVLHPELGSVTVGAGALTLEPSAGGLPNMLFNDGECLYVHRSLTCDFEVST